jgi:hypothetical protein
MAGYAPQAFRALRYHDATPFFADGADSPRAYLERCLETIARCEAVVRAWVALNEAGARAADASTARWRRRPAALADRRHTDRHQGPDRDARHADRDGLRGLPRQFAQAR